jgi:hypothetical protein
MQNGSWQSVLDAIFCEKKLVNDLHQGRWFSLGTPVSSTNKTEHHDITEILIVESGV